MLKKTWSLRASKFFDLDSELRRSVAHPFIISKIPKQGNLAILDFGCGEGELLEDLTTKNKNNKYFGYDPSVQSIDKAIGKKLNIKFYSQLEDLHKTSIQFDIIIISFVLITIPNKEEASLLFKNIIQLLKNKGKFIFVDTHPCFRNKIFSTFDMNLPIRNYSKSFTKYRVNMIDANDTTKTISFSDYHKSLEEIFRLIIENGFSISKLHELYDSISFIDSPTKIIKSRMNKENPAFIYLEGIK